jgi:tetratricopeptide (TPR) repeat protein
MRRKPASPEVATPAEVWENMMRVPLGIFQVMTFPDTWLCFALLILLGALYVMVPALLLSYLPSRLFGATKGTFVLDLSLGILLSIIAGLIIWGKVNRAREKRRLTDKVDALRQRNAELQANLAKVIEQKGRNHPETGYAYRELGENWKQLGGYQKAEKAHREELEIFRETLGAKSPEVARASRSIAGLIFMHERSQEKSTLLWEAEKIEKGYR